VDALDLARLQFGAVTVYHFLFVPITIGLSGLVAFCETRWVMSHHEHWLRLTKFFGKLFLINFAIGVATGLVQEFQFGMNWSAYSRFVGDIFGAPLAIEGLLAFFLESTFLGLWIFGWDRLSPRVHAACIWAVHIGTLLSAYFILAANSWMQHPVGYRFNPRTGRAELNDFAAVLFNKVQLVSFPHTVLAAYMTGAAFMLGVAVWLQMRSRTADRDRVMYGRATRLSAVVLLVAGLGVAASGDLQGKVMTEVQPMKMASAEALYQTEQPASFSILTIGSLDGSKETFSVKVPRLLSFLATGSWTGKVQGINDLRGALREDLWRRPGSDVLLGRRLHARHPGHLLGVPDHDRPRLAGRRLRGPGALAHPTRPDPARAAVAVDLPVDAPAAGVRELVRLDLHRDGSSALERLRPDDHHQRRVAGRPRVAGAHLTALLHPAVRRAGGRRGRADPAHGPVRGRRGAGRRPVAGPGGPSTRPRLLTRCRSR
jgi:cytochrome bd-type quinol oxidase subunit 1